MAGEMLSMAAMWNNFLKNASSMTKLEFWEVTFWVFISALGVLSAQQECLLNIVQVIL